MTGLPPPPESAADRSRLVLAFALALLGAHTIHVWGSTSLMWADIGRWSHEVERLAQGELPYRDFHWHYPPLGLWVEGLLARVVGTNHANLTAITASLAVILVVGAVAYTRRVLERSDAALVGVGLVLAFAHAQMVGAAIPQGLYSPAALVGAVCMVIAATHFVRHLAESRTTDALLLALWAGLAVLSKQDFWIPSAYIVTVAMLRSRSLAPPLVSATVVGLGVAIVIATAGTGVLLPMVGGFGHATLAGGQGFPSWERITLDLFVLAVIGTSILALVGLASGRWYWRPLLALATFAAATGLFVIWMTTQVAMPIEGELLTPRQDRLLPHLTSGASLLRPSVAYFARKLSFTPLPVALAPVLLLWMALRWRSLPQPRRNTVALLLGLAVALRARRAFEGTEWFEFLLTLPILVAALELLLPLEGAARRRFRVGLAGVLAVLAVWAYVAQGRGFGTRRYFPTVTQTGRGAVHWPENLARDYRTIRATLDSLDPSGQRPFYAFAFSGGWNYWLERPNPYPFTQDFYFSAFDADSVLALPRPSGLFLLDFPRGMMDPGGFGAARFDLRRWEQPMVPAPYGFYDRPRFERLRQGCQLVPMEGLIYTLYQCP